MAEREFHCTISNKWDNPLYWSDDYPEHGVWQDPWYPSSASPIDPNSEAEWRAESDGWARGTAGWVRWSVRVLDDVNDAGPDGLGHFEFVQINWHVPFYGSPSVTFAVFRNNPSESDSFAQTDNKPPVLEFVPTSFNGSVIDGASELVPYVLAIPWSFFTGNAPTHIQVTCTVRRRQTAQTQSRLTFPSAVPSRQQMAMQGFRYRMEKALQAVFVGGFPNFYEATHGRNHVGGTVFVKQATAEWLDIPLAELGNVALEDFAERMRATNTWASQHGFIGGFPTFFHADYGSGIVCGSVLIKSDGTEFRDIPLSELGNPALEDFEARFRATQDYATRNGFVGGFPTLFHAKNVVDVDVRTGQKKYATVCGTILLKQGEIDIHTLQRMATFAERRDVLLFQDPA